MNPILIAQTVIFQIITALTDHQRSIYIDGKDFMPLGVSLEDGSGWNWLIEGYWKGSHNKAEVYVNFKTMNHQITF